MTHRILPLTPEHRDELLGFFDTAFSDKPEWAGCFCMFPYIHHATEDWDARPGERNRADAAERISRGRMKGHVAVADGRVVGWVNAGPKAMYRSLLDEPDPHGDHDLTGRIFCFLVDPAHRGQGVARALLEAACEGLKEQGMAIAEANPRPGTDDPGANHRGPLSLYLSAGFTLDREDESDGTVFVRRPLLSF